MIETITDEQWRADLRERCLKELWDGVENGWWQDVDEAALAPILVRKVSDFHETALMAHAVVELGAAPSVKQAKRNGWGGPLKPGTIRIGTRIMRIEE